MIMTKRMTIINRKNKKIMPAKKKLRPESSDRPPISTISQILKRKVPDRVNRVLEGPLRLHFS